MLHFQIPIESMKSPFWSAHFHGLVPGFTNIFYSHSLIQIGRMAETDKDLEIMVLRYQLGIAERK